MEGLSKYRGGWLKNPTKPRPNEIIGGGWFVFRRGDGTKRIRPAMWPFEYGDREAALAEARRLSAERPGYKFIVVGQTDAVMADPS